MKPQKKVLLTLCLLPTASLMHGALTSPNQQANQHSPTHQFPLGDDANPLTAVQHGFEAALSDGDSDGDDETFIHRPNEAHTELAVGSTERTVCSAKKSDQERLAYIAEQIAILERNPQALNDARSATTNDILHCATQELERMKRVNALARAKALREKLMKRSLQQQPTSTQRATVVATLRNVENGATDAAASPVDIIVSASSSLATLGHHHPLLEIIL